MTCVAAFSASSSLSVSTPPLSSSATAPILRGAPLGGESERIFFAFFKPGCRKHTVHLREHLAAGRRAPGIFTLNPNMTLGETADELVLIWGASEAEEYMDQLNYLPLSS